MAARRYSPARGSLAARRSATFVRNDTRQGVAYYFFSRSGMSNHHYIYIVRCADGTLFTGVSDDVDRSVREMNAGAPGAYVRNRAPVFLAYTEEYMNARDAESRATAIKRMNRVGKERLLSCVGLSTLEYGLAA